MKWTELNFIPFYSSDGTSYQATVYINDKTVFVTNNPETEFTSNPFNVTIKEPEKETISYNEITKERVEEILNNLENETD